MKKTICLLCMLFTFMCTYAKKEYIQFCTWSGTIHISGALPAPLKEKIKSESSPSISKKDLEEILGHKIDYAFEESYMADFLNYLADYGFELQQVFQKSDTRCMYILVRDTEKKD